MIKVKFKIKNNIYCYTRLCYSNMTGSLKKAFNILTK